MWNFLVKFILRNRLANLLIIIALTTGMAFFAFKAELSYEYAQMLPEHDPVNQVYQKFRKTFREDGSIFFVGMKTEKMKQLDFFKKWDILTREVKEKSGVKEVFSLSSLFYFHKNEDLKKFELKPFFEKMPETQAEYDSLYQQAMNLKFYEDFVFSSDKNLHLMLIWIEEPVLNSSERVPVIYGIHDHIDLFAQEHNVDIHYSGLPYIRTIISQKIKQELLLFMLLSVVVSMLILLFFFRSVRAVVLPIAIVGIGVIWSMGIMVLIGYKITVLTGILPPILIIIGIENCIYLLTRYHREIQEHGGVGRALARVIQKVGYATLLTNITTAVGFGAFIVTGNSILVEFGIVASISIILMFVFSIILIPVLYSYFSAPKERHTKHLDKKWFLLLHKGIYSIVAGHRSTVFVFTVILFLSGLIGIFFLDQKGTMVDDIPHGDPLYTDMLFFEKHLGGVLPYEISIDTRKRNGITDLKTINKINEFQNLLIEHPQTGKPLSYVEIIKFAKQAFYNNNPNMFDVPGNHERNFIFSYMPRLDSTSTHEMLQAFTDTSMQIARVSARLKNVDTKEIKIINAYFREKADSIFPPKDYDVDITGTSVVFLKGSGYLVKNLLWSLVVAMIVISILMYFLFNSFRMVLVSMVPNILPQIMTAALMGYLGIDIKPSTIIIYSIALGISVDAAIHLLSRYRQQLLVNNWDVKKSVESALRETSIGMVYSGIVLILGFAVFTLSKFGGTQSLGYLIAFTLTMAMFSNLILLPSLILRFEKSVTTKAFAKPIFEILSEEEDTDDEETEDEPDDEEDKGA
jgi:uncharacterized protein